MKKTTGLMAVYDPKQKKYLNFEVMTDATALNSTIEVLLLKNVIVLLHF